MNNTRFQTIHESHFNHKFDQHFFNLDQQF